MPNGSTTETATVNQKLISVKTEWPSIEDCIGTLLGGTQDRPWTRRSNLAPQRGRGTGKSPRQTVQRHDLRLRAAARGSGR
jgi:hypothetical protein